MKRKTRKIHKTRAALKTPPVQDWGLATFKTRADAEKVAAQVKKLGFRTAVTEISKDNFGLNKTYGPWEVVVLKLDEKGWIKMDKLEESGKLAAIFSKFQGGARANPRKYKPIQMTTDNGSRNIVYRIEKRSFDEYECFRDGEHFATKETEEKAQQACEADAKLEGAEVTSFPAWDEEVFNINPRKREGYYISWEEYYVDHDAQAMAEKNTATLTKVFADRGLVSGCSEEIFGYGGVDYEIDDEIPDYVQYNLYTTDKVAFIECWEMLFTMRGEVLRGLLDFDVPGLKIDYGEWRKAEAWVKANKGKAAKNPRGVQIKPEDITYSYGPDGHELYYKGKSIGGAGRDTSAYSYKKYRGGAVASNREYNRKQAELDKQNILSGRIAPYMLENIKKIDAEVKANEGKAAKNPRWATKEFLEKPFGLKGKRVVIIGGDYKGEKGTILQETGYTEGYGVVCKIKLDNGYVGEWDHAGFEEIRSSRNPRADQYAVEFAPDGKHWQVDKTGSVDKMWNYFNFDPTVREFIAVNPAAKVRLINTATKQVIGTLPREVSCEVNPRGDLRIGQDVVTPDGWGEVAEIFENGRVLVEFANRQRKQYPREDLETTENYPGYKGNPRGKRACKACGKPLSTGDYGYYCSNQDCSEYDKDILACEGNPRGDETYKEIKELYQRVGLKRRFRTARDGIWIFGYAGPAGIFVSKYDWANDKNYVLNTYLPNVDDDLERSLEGISPAKNKDILACEGNPREIKRGDKVELLSKLRVVHDRSGYDTKLPVGYCGIVKEILNDGILLESHYIGETDVYKISRNDALNHLKVVIPSNIKDATVLNPRKWEGGPLTNPDAPATRAQRWALFCMTKEDYRTRDITKQQASDLISKLKAERGDRGEDTDWRAVYEEAVAAGNAAYHAAKPIPMHVAKHADIMNDASPVVKTWDVPEGVCGFAWVHMSATTPENRQFIKANKAHVDRDTYAGGFYVDTPMPNTQSLARKEAYCQAFAGVLRKHGLKAYSQSRLD